jgi:hypothetical protein
MPEEPLVMVNTVVEQFMEMNQDDEEPVRAIARPIS